MLMTLGLFYISEVEDLTTINHFIMIGVYGSYIIVTLGLMLEAGLGLMTDYFIENFFLVTGIVLNIVNSSLAFYDYYVQLSPYTETLNKGFVSLTCVVIYLIDIFVLNCTK